MQELRNYTQRTAIKDVCVNRRSIRADRDTLGRKLSRCKEVMARVFAVMQELCGVRAVSRYRLYRSREIITGYKTDSEHLSSIAVQTITEPKIYHGARVKLRAAARIRMQEPLEIFLDAGAKAKTVTIQMTFIDRVSG